MVRETKEARKLREAAERVTREAEAKAAQEAYIAALPKRMFEAQALAASLGVSTDTSMTASGPRVDFFADNNDGVFIRTSLTYETRDWEISELESELRLIKHRQDERATRQQIAQVAFDTLSATEQSYLREFIHYVRAKL